MIQTIKISIAIVCLILGCLTTIFAPDLLTTNHLWLNPAVTLLSFVLIIVAGVYCFSKVIKPLIF